MRSGSSWSLALAILTIGSPAAAQAPLVAQAPVQRAEQCPADRSPIMILGTYHMANPGLDAINTEADNVLAPRRQREIAELANRLARFRPTKIMLEAAYADRHEDQARYRRYVAGTYQLTHNESEQIGFRLAKQLGHASVYPIDFPMFMSGQSYDKLDFSVRPKPAPAPAAASSSPPRELTEGERRLRASTVADFLAWMNRAEQWRPSHLAYMSLFEPEPGEISIYAKTNNLTNWYQRNFRMWANIVRVTERPMDRPLLIVGSGHLAILRQLAQDMPGFCLVEPEAYLRP